MSEKNTKNMWGVFYKGEPVAAYDDKTTAYEHATDEHNEVRRVSLTYTAI